MFVLLIATVSVRAESAEPIETSEPLSVIPLSPRVFAAVNLGIVLVVPERFDVETLQLADPGTHDGSSVSPGL